MINKEMADKYGKLQPAGTVLFRQGEPGQVMFVICSGKVEVVRSVGDKETVLAVLPAGEFIGEMSIINNRPRSATARVVEDAELLIIDGKTFESMIRKNTEIALRIMKKMADRLEATGRQLEVLLFRDPNSRVVHYLRQEAEARGTPVATGIAVSVSDDELIERLGLSPEEVTVVVERLIRARLVSREEDQFVIAEIGKLQDFLDFIEMKEQYGTPPKRIFG